MEEAADTLRSFFEGSLLQINHELFEAESKTILRLSGNEKERSICYQCGLTSDLCDWFLQCNDYFIQISNAVQFSTYAETPVNVTVSMSVLSVATNIVRILRNICSGSKQNKQVVMSKGIIRCIAGLCKDKHLWGAGEMTWSEWYELFLQIAVQLLFNVTAGSSFEIRNEVWIVFIPDCFTFLMKHYSHNAKLTSYAIAVLYNLVNYQESTPREFAHLEYVVKSRDVMHLVFSRGLPDNEEMSSLASPWITLLMELILRYHSFTTPLFTDTLNSLSTSSFSLVSPAQLLLLSFLLANLDANPSLQLEDPLCQDLLLWILQSVHSSQLLLLSGDRLQCNQTILNQRYEESEEGKKLCMFIEAIGTCLSVVASQANFFSSSLKLFMLRSEVFDFFLAILAIPQMIPDPSKTPTVGECGEIQGTPMIQQKDDAWSFGTRDAVLQILGNLVYLNRSAQDQVRIRGGIELILNHTKMHPQHPLQREWALFTIRNLCADNEDNQRYIDGFKAQGIASEPALEKLGLKTEVQDGKMKVERL